MKKILKQYGYMILIYLSAGLLYWGSQLWHSSLSYETDLVIMLVVFVADNIRRLNDADIED